MLKHGDFCRVPGYDLNHRALLRSLLQEFVSDVDEEYKNASS